MKITAEVDIALTKDHLRDLLREDTWGFVDLFELLKEADDKDADFKLFEMAWDWITADDFALFHKRLLDQPDIALLRKIQAILNHYFPDGEPENPELAMEERCRRDEIASQRVDGQYYWDDKDPW
jgi:hypothetical protein